MSNRWGSDHYKTAWSSKSTKIEKNWGEEIHVGTLNTISMKVLLLEKKKSTTLKYYDNKNEVLYVRKGCVLVEYDSEKFHWVDPGERRLKQQTLVGGDVFFVQSSCPYRLTAIEDTEIIEIGDNNFAQSKKVDLNLEP